MQLKMNIRELSFYNLLTFWHAYSFHFSISLPLFQRHSISLTKIQRKLYNLFIKN